MTLVDVIDCVLLECEVLLLLELVPLWLLLLELVPLLLLLVDDEELLDDELLLLLDDELLLDVLEELLSFSL